MFHGCTKNLGRKSPLTGIKLFINMFEVKTGRPKLIYLGLFIFDYLLQIFRKIKLLKWAMNSDLQRMIDNFIYQLT